MDEDISRELLRVLKKDGMEFMLSTKVKGATVKGKRSDSHGWNKMENRWR
jgi:pyruvate/2-oxoglutarate dehydrogenase complex dihydrolipoamide dehydrogenase (E3) component